MILVRDTRNSSCTVGKLCVTGQWVDTLERPWVPSKTCDGGTKGVSCVPPGVYQLVPHKSDAHPDTWALVNDDLDVVHYDTDVPTARRPNVRTCVLIHPANWVSELRGCIAPGLRSKEGNAWMVLGSRESFARIRAAITAVKKPTLTIIESIID